MLSEEFEVKMGVHRESVLIPPMFITVLKVVSRTYRTRLPWELFYADDPVLIADSEDGVLE